MKLSRHRWTGRYEAHLWDNSCKKEGQTRKGRQGTVTNQSQCNYRFKCVITTSVIIRLEQKKTLTNTSVVVEQTDVVLAVWGWRDIYAYGL